MKVGEEYLMIKSLVDIIDVSKGKCYIGKEWMTGVNIGVEIIDNIGDVFDLISGDFIVVGRLKVTKTP